MDIDRLITMANDIASFFHATEDQDEAAGKVATHLRLYWHPRMRAQIVAHFKAGGAGLSDLAAQAIRLLSDQAHAAN